MTGWEFTYEDGDSEIFDLDKDQSGDLQEKLEQGIEEGYQAFVELFHQDGHCFINMAKVRFIDIIPQNPKPRSKKAERESAW